MTDTIYVFRDTKWINKNLYKIGSTKNIKHRMMTYKTIFFEFNCNIILYTYTFTHKELSCYNVDKIINVLSSNNNIPFVKYTNEILGGTEFYLIDDLNKLDIFLRDKLNVSFIKKNIDVVELLKDCDNDIIYGEECKYNSEIIDKYVNLISKGKEIILKDWQKDFVKNFEEFIISTFNSGIVIAPTGCGKSFMMMYVSLMYIKKYKNDVLIITKRKEIFNDFKKKLTDMEIVLDIHIDIFDCINNKYKKTIFNNKTDINRIILINSDKFIMSKEFGYIESNKTKNYDNINYGKIKLCIQDECHWSGGDELFNYLDFVKTKVDKLVGFSATPTRVKEKNRNQTLKIYGDGKEPNIIFEKDYLSAIYDNDILSVSIDIFSVRKDHDTSEFIHKGKTYYVLNNSGMKQLFEYLEKIESYKHKGVIWFKNINNAEKFYKYVKDKKSNYKFYLSCSKTKSESLDEIKIGTEEIYKFKNENENAILLAVYRATEGFDDPKVDFAIRAYFGKNIDPILEIQRMGRVMRVHLDKKFGQYITMELNNDNEDELYDRLADITKIFKHQRNKNIKKKKNKLSYQETIKIFHLGKSMKTTPEEFENKLIKACLKNNPTKNMREFKRYINNLNSNTDKYICTIKEIEKLIEKYGYDFKLPNNIVKFSLGDDLFDKFKLKFYDVETFKKICKKFKNIKEYEKNDDKLLPSLELIDSGFYNGNEDDKFSICNYFKQTVKN
jgi:superfamily II DNA or RNA helicase